MVSILVSLALLASTDGRPWYTAQDSRVRALSCSAVLGLVSDGVDLASGTCWPTWLVADLSPGERSPQPFFVDGALYWWFGLSELDGFWGVTQ